MTSSKRIARIWLGVAVAALAAVAAPPSWAASDVGVGGYHDEILKAAHRDLLGAADAGAGIQITVDAGGDSRLSSSFTPRFGGFGFAGAERGDVDYGSLLKQSFAQEDGGGSTRGLRIGNERGFEVGGVAIGWSATAELSAAPAAGAGTGEYMLGGEFAVSGVRLDAGYGHSAGLLGLDGSRMTAGVGYALGPLDTRVGYSLVENPATVSETSLFTLGSQLALRPGLVVKGDLAYAEGEDGAPATAGLVSLRLSF